MLKLKFLSLVAMLIVVLTSCEISENRNIEPINKNKENIEYSGIRESGDDLEDNKSGSN